MSLRKYISLFVLLMMLATQGAVAHHLTVHAAEGVPLSQKKDEGHVDAGDLCDLCLLAKSIGQAVDAPIAVLKTPENIHVAFIPDVDQRAVSTLKAPYAARAPPTAA